MNVPLKVVCIMELERFNLEDAPEIQQEEEQSEDKSRCPWIKCSIHDTVAKWMLPEEARATYLERANCIPPPIFILAISLAELAAFIYYAVWKPQKQWITLDMGIWESPFIYRPDKRKEAWRFLSYMFLHAGLEHIIGNLVLQLCLGIPLELVHKGHRVGAVYLAGVIAGSLASSICDPLQGLVGASGGVYALIGGYFMNILVNFREMIPLFGVARLLFISLIDGINNRATLPKAPFLDAFQSISADGKISPVLNEIHFLTLGMLYGLCWCALQTGYTMQFVWGKRGYEVYWTILISSEKMAPALFSLALYFFKITSTYTFLWEQPISEGETLQIWLLTICIKFLVGTDVGFALYRRFLSPLNGLQVSFVAHIAGGLAGMSVGYVIFSNFDKKFIKDPRFWICITVYLIFVGFAVVFNMFFSPANQ